MYFLSDYLNNFFTINLPGSFPFLNVLFSLSCLLMSFISHQYSFLNSFIISFVFSKFFFLFQVSDSTVNPLYLTKYLSFPLICHLFKILSTSHSSSPSIIMRAGCFFLCPSTCPTYFCILLTFTTRCILTVLGNSSSTVFDNTILSNMYAVLNVGWWLLSKHDKASPNHD